MSRLTAPDSFPRSCAALRIIVARLAFVCTDTCAIPIPMTRSWKDTCLALRHSMNLGFQSRMGFHLMTSLLPTNPVQAVHPRLPL